MGSRDWESRDWESRDWESRDLESRDLESRDLESRDLEIGMYHVGIGGCQKKEGMALWLLTINAHMINSLLQHSKCIWQM